MNNGLDSQHALGAYLDFGALHKKTDLYAELVNGVLLSLALGFYT